MMNPFSFPPSGYEVHILILNQCKTLNPKPNLTLNSLLSFEEKVQKEKDFVLEINDNAPIPNVSIGSKIHI